MAEYRLCSIEGCGKKHFGHGWCAKHHRLWRIYGDPMHRRPPKAVCRMPDCERQVHAADLCKMHRKRELRHGDPTARKRVANGDHRRWLEAHLSHEGDDCLLWPFPPTERNGYGPSRIMCEMANGARPTPGHQAAHSCGNGHLKCVHPRHLRWATYAENRQDMVGHGRSLRGRKNPNAKIDEATARLIRGVAGSKSNAKVAEDFGVSRSTVNDIKSKRSWAWLEH